MENGSAGSVATFNARNAESLMAKSHTTSRYEDSSTLTPASDNNHSNDDNDDDDDDVLSNVLLQVHHAYILPPATSTYVSQFSKRLESYGGVTTDHISYQSSRASLGCSSCGHETADDDDGDDECSVNVGDCRHTFELCRDRIVQETLKDVSNIKNSTTSDIPRGVYCRRRQCRPNWFRDRSVSIPPYLRPIEEEPDNEDQMDSLSVDCAQEPNNHRATISSAGARDDVITQLHHDVITNGGCTFDEDGTDTYDVTEPSSRDCRQPMSDRKAMENCLCTCDDGGANATSDNYVSDNDVMGESLSRDSIRPTSGGDTCRTGRNNFIPDAVTGESRSRQRWRQSYVIMASLMAFIACLTAVSPSCIIFVVIVTSLITHHLIS